LRRSHRRTNNNFREFTKAKNFAADECGNDFLVQSQLGFCLEPVGRVAAGISYLRKGASLNSSYGPVWEHLGLAYQKKGNHKEAMKAFEKATQLMPKAPRPWQHLADEYGLAGRPVDADRAAARAQQLGIGTPKLVKKKA
jgi:Flp pilus assembly protein TadD